MVEDSQSSARLGRVPIFGVITASMGAALIMSVTLNVLLAHRIRSFDLARETKRATLLLKAGVAVPPITAQRFGGQEGEISYDTAAQPTILYVFTPTCIWCARNLKNFKTLLDKEGGHYRFIGLSLSEQTLAEYVAKNDLKFPIYSGLSPETLKTYKLGSTPQTIVISPEGKVLQDWAGAYVGDQKSQVEAFFHVNLPGLTPTAEPSNATARRN